MSICEQLSAAVESGNANKVKELVQQAIDEGLDISSVLNDGLLAGMASIGVKFKNNQVYVPEVLIAARAMNAGMALLEPELMRSNIKPVGKALLGTVHGDLHDIGKNLVAMMFRGTGIEVTDIGIDVPASVFVDRAEEIEADMICISALLTTTMPAMKDIIDELERRGVRDKYIVMVGGAPVTQSFADTIGADLYAPDAASAAEVASSTLKDK